MNTKQLIQKLDSIEFELELILFAVEASKVKDGYYGSHREYAINDLRKTLTTLRNATTELARYER